MWGFNLGEELENIMGEDPLCSEWMGEIRLHGLLFENPLVGKVVGIPDLEKGHPYQDWSDASKEKYDALIQPISDSLYLDFHYIPKIDCWNIGTRGHAQLRSRRMIGWRSNECIFSKTVYEKNHESLRIEVYERNGVISKQGKFPAPRLAFCLLYSKGIGVENEDTCVVAEYPLPGRLGLNSSRGEIEQSLQRHDKELEELGWEISDEGVSDPSGKDYFGDYQMIEWPPTYSNKGITIQRII